MLSLGAGMEENIFQWDVLRNNLPIKVMMV